MAYSFKRTFTVDHTKVGASDQTAFPTLICGTITAFKTAANSGHIQNTVSFNGVTVPADICFYSDSGLTTAIPFEISSYSASTGAIVIWVKRDLSHTSDTAIYCGYDDSGVTTYQGGSVGDAWDSNYVAVYHLGDGTTLSLKDSTANGRNLTNTGTHVTAGSGPTSPLGGAVFNGSNTDLVTSAFTLGETTALTVALWYKNASNSVSGMYVEKSNVNSSWALFQESGSIKLRGGGTSSDVASLTFPTVATWHALVATISGSTSGKIYTDGSANGSATVDTLGDTSTALHLGNYDNSGYFFNGSLSCIRISKTARSADWITATYNNQSSPSSFYTDSGESSNGGGSTYSSSISVGPTAAVSTGAAATFAGNSASLAATPALSDSGATKIPVSNTLAATSGISDSGGTVIPVSSSIAGTATSTATPGLVIPSSISLAATPAFIAAQIMILAASLSLDGTAGVSDGPALTALAAAIISGTPDIAASGGASTYSASISLDLTAAIAAAVSQSFKSAISLDISPALLDSAIQIAKASASIAASSGYVASSTEIMRAALSLAITAGFSASLPASGARTVSKAMLQGLKDALSLKGKSDSAILTGESDPTDLEGEL